MRKETGGDELCMLLLLLSCILYAAATWPVSCAADSPAGPAAAQVGDSKQLVIPGLPLLPPILGGGDPKLVKCWKSLLGVENCVTSVFSSLVGGQIRLTSECCRAIDGLGDYCFHKIFVLRGFGAIFPNLLKSYCAAPVVPSPSKVQERIREGS